MYWEKVLDNADSVIQGEPRLVVLPPRGKAVFVGDTHGDQEASRQVVQRFLKDAYRIVFLGDYIDRGNFSRENLLFLLQMKYENPERIFLLAGNHEGYREKEFYPANFWESLSQEEQERLGLLFSRFPLAATSGNGILSLHGGLPDLNSLGDMNRIRWGDVQWEKVLWGDFVENEEEHAGEWGGRPQFGRSYFERLMERYGKRILIRSHQPSAPLVTYGGRCVTLFTSAAYVSIRTIAIADLDREIRDAKDLTFERI